MSLNNAIKDKPLEWSSVMDIVNNVRVDELGVIERTSSLATRSIKREAKLDALKRIVTMCDLTTLEGEDT